MSAGFQWNELDCNSLKFQLVETHSESVFHNKEGYSVNSSVEDDIWQGSVMSTWTKHVLAVFQINVKKVYSYLGGLSFSVIHLLVFCIHMSLLYFYSSALKHFFFFQ